MNLASALLYPRSEKQFWFFHKKQTQIILLPQGNKKKWLIYEKSKSPGASVNNVVITYNLFYGILLNTLTARTSSNCNLFDTANLNLEKALAL